MNYISYEYMANTIRQNLWKIPEDVDLIVGVPRSGMIPALMIAELLNKPCTDLDFFIQGRTMSCGRRGGLMKDADKSFILKKILIIDDTCYTGGSIQRVKDKVSPLKIREYQILFGCVYAEGKHSKQFVDIYFEENYRPGEGIWLYEWNILHHYEKKSRVSMWDIDGLICKDPPSDKNIEEYEAYLKNPIPMIIPTTLVGEIVTYRLEKYRNLTEEFLQKQGIKYGKLIMFNAPNRQERNLMMGPAEFKANVYKNADWAQLFIESEIKQAEKIFELSGKPVFCYANGKVYQ